MLVDAVERLMRGEAVIDPVLVAQLMRRDVGELSNLRTASGKPGD